MESQGSAAGEGRAVARVYWGMQERESMPLLSAHDVRSLFRLLGELRELGDAPDAWRSHLVSQLASMCGTRLTTASELSVRTTLPEETTHCGHVVSCVHERVAGLGPEASAQFQRAVLEMPNDHDPASTKLVPLYGSSFTRARSELANDRDWYSSSAANDYYRHYDCDDYIKSMEPVSLPGGASLLHAITLYRGWREQPFGDRERTLVQLLHEQLAADWREVHAPAPQLANMPTRLRQTCALLMRGLSEKEVAAELELSTHTVHQYVKELYRRLQVRSRGELHARLTKPTKPHAQLAARL